jgi:hypothetical protein
MPLNNAELQAFYRHKLLDNQEIKLVQENPNMNKNYILVTELVNHFSTSNCFNLFYLIFVSTGQLIPNRSTSLTNFQKLIYFQQSCQLLNQR